MNTDPLVWHDGLSVGNRVVDLQHKTLIQLIDSIPETASPNDEIYLREALRYAASHFVDEEAFMAEIQFPDLIHHKIEHQKLTGILLAYKNDFDCGKTDLASFKQFMFKWVKEHIMKEDIKIGLFLASGSHSRV